MASLTLIHPAPPRLYRSRYAGPILLVCRKCEKKLKPQPKLKKSLKRLQKGDPNPLQVLSVSCMKLCPKDAVAVCPPAQLTQYPPQLQIIRTTADLVQLLADSRT